MTNIQDLLLTYLIFSVLAAPITLWQTYKEMRATFQQRSEVLYLVLLSFEDTISVFKYRALTTILLCTIVTAPITLLFIIYSAIKERVYGKSELDMYFDRQDEIEKLKVGIKETIQNTLDMTLPDVNIDTKDYVIDIDTINPLDEPDYSTVIDDDLIDFANFFSMHYKGMKFGDFYEGKEGYKFKYVNNEPKGLKTRFGIVVYTGTWLFGKSTIVLSKKGIKELAPSKDFIFFSVIWAAVKLETQRKFVHIQNNLISDAITIKHCRNIGLDLNKIQMDFARQLKNNKTQENKERIIKLNKYVALNNKKKEVRAERRKN